MKVIESVDELNELKQKLETKPSVWYPMWVDNEKHPLNTHISFVFIATDSNKYILPQQHSDCLSLSKQQITDTLNTAGEKWVFQKKKILQSFDNITTKLNDLDTSYFLKTGEVIDYSQPFQHLITPYYHRGYRDDIIQSIPILKLCESIEKELDKVYKIHSDTYDWYNDKFIPILSDMERYGVRVDTKKFIDRWPQAQKHISSDSRVYTEYNPFTVTGRPSNRHGGVNYAALNKSDGSRECFVSEGIFLQMDYDAYHPRLIGKMVGFPLPQTSVHQWLAEQYGCELGEGKGITFRLLYGGIDDDFRQIPYFDKVADWIEKLWGETQRNGYLQTKYRRIPLDWIEGANPQKVFNYLLQALETEMNVDKLEKILEHIKGTECQFSLYTYDSFLLDYPIDGNTKLALELKEIITESGFPIKASWGTDYGKV